MEMEAARDEPKMTTILPAASIYVDTYRSPISCNRRRARNFDVKK